MAYKEVLRVDISEVIRRWQAGISRRQIASGTGLSRETVGKYIAAAEGMGVSRDGAAPTEEQLSQLAAISRPGPQQASIPTEEKLAPWADQIYRWLTGDRLQLTRVSGEPVPVGDHNSKFVSAVKPFQYGEQSLAFPVGSTSGVSDNLGSGIEFPHLGDLTLEVSPLLGGADPAVADGLWICLSPQEGVDVIETLASGVAVEGDFPLAGIASQSLGMESEPLCGFAACQIGHTFILT